VDTLLGSSQMFISVPITIWLFTVHWGGGAREERVSAHGQCRTSGGDGVK
jgi:hypothetical protein